MPRHFLSLLPLSHGHAWLRSETSARLAGLPPTTTRLRRDLQDLPVEVTVVDDKRTQRGILQRDGNPWQPFGQFGDRPDRAKLSWGPMELPHHVDFTRNQAVKTRKKVVGLQHAEACCRHGNPASSGRCRDPSGRGLPRTPPHSDSVRFRRAWPRINSNWVADTARSRRRAPRCRSWRNPRWCRWRRFRIRCCSLRADSGESCNWLPQHIECHMSRRCRYR